MPPTLCSPPVTVSDTTSNVYNTVSLPPCCGLPACDPNQEPTIISATPPGAPVNVATTFTIVGTNFDCRYVPISPDGSAIINSYTIDSTTGVTVNATLVGTGDHATIVLTGNCDGVAFRAHHHGINEGSLIFIMPKYSLPGAENKIST